MGSTLGTKCAFITGGSRGIGKGIALVLAEQGYDIAITYNAAVGEAEDTKHQVEALGRRCFFYQASLEKGGGARGRYPAGHRGSGAARRVGQQCRRHQAQLALHH